jgi:hypothetical protein
MSNDRLRKPANLEYASPRRPLSLWRFALFGSLPLEHETCLFLLVNLADFVVTAWLTHGGGFREANWLAVWVLQNWGWHGLLVYKFGLVTAICLLAQVIARHRPETARRLLSGATALFALVLAAAVVLAVLA